VRRLVGLAHSVSVRRVGPSRAGTRPRQLEEDPRERGRSAATRRQRLQAGHPRHARRPSHFQEAPTPIVVSDGVRRTDTSKLPGAMSTRRERGTSVQAIRLQCFGPCFPRAGGAVGLQRPSGS